MTETDLLVIGGGPAGAAIATLARRAGASVVLLERDRFPRPKVCGEFLSPEGCAVVDRLGVLDELRAQGARPMDGCLLADAAGRSVTSGLPRLGAIGRDAYGISRYALDAALLRRAAEAGVSVRERIAAISPIVEDGRVRGVRARPIDSRAGDESVRATLVVAADGRRSMLQRALRPGIGDPLTTSDRSWFGFQAHFPDRTGGLDGRIELYVFDGGYAGLGPVEGGRLDLALIARVDALRACGNAPQKLFERRMLRNPLLAQRLGGLAPCSTWKTIGPLRFNVRAPASHGAIFLGDAAGTIDPFSGEGMSNALAGAELALPFVLEAIARGGLSDDSAARWSSAWRRAFAPVTRRARLFGHIFRHPRPASWAMSLLKLPSGARLLPGLIAATRTGSA